MALEMIDRFGELGRGRSVSKQERGRDGGNERRGVCLTDRLSILPARVLGWSQIPGKWTSQSMLWKASSPL